MSGPSPPPVLIVGSGPSGLILALSLSRSGIPVRVIEKTKTHRIGQRGAGVMPRTFEAFEALGIINDVIKQAVGIPPFRMYKMPEGVEVVREFRAAPILDPTSDRPHLNAMLLGQDKLDRIIRAELERSGVFVEIGTELESFEQLDDRVNVKILKHSLTDDDKLPSVEETSYKWVIGADGAKGKVRKQLGLSFIGETREQVFAVGDLYVEGLEEGKWHMWGDVTSLFASIRSTETRGVFNFIIGGSNLDDLEEIFSNEDSIKKLLKKGTANREDIKWGEIICASPYRVNIRMVDNFKRGRVFVTGDAGHIHSPTGGQGMNTGIQDSYNLGWKLALVIKGLAPESLLNTFNEERLPVVAEMLNITTAMLKKTLENSKDAFNRTGDINQLGVNYRFSSIVVDEESEAAGIDRSAGSAYSIDVNEPVRAGDRAPDAPGLIKDGENNEAVRLFKLLNPTRHTVLIFSSKVNSQPVLDVLAAYSPEVVNPIIISKLGEKSPGENISTFQDRDGHAYSAYKGPDGTTGIFAIRPDGVIGARVGSAEGLKKYLGQIFKS